MKSKLTVQSPGIREMLQLPQMFERAVDEDFTQYSKSTREKIKGRYSLLHLLSARYRPGRILLSAKRDDTFAGLLLAQYTGDGVGVIHWVYVSPDQRKNGIAKKLIQEAETQFKEKDCHKLVVMTEFAQKFYQNIGFIKEAVFKQHWWGKDYSVYSKYI